MLDAQSGSGGGEAKSPSNNAAADNEAERRKQAARRELETIATAVEVFKVWGMVDMAVVLNLDSTEGLFHCGVGCNVYSLLSFTHTRAQTALGSLYVPRRSGSF